MIAISVLTVLAVLLGLAALIPFTRISHGIVRMCEFPRLQMVAIAFPCLLLTPVLVTDPAWLYPLIATFFGVLAIHAYAIGQFTPLRKAQSHIYGGNENDENVVSILGCNVKMSNPDYLRCLDMTRRANADLALFMEVDEKWAEGLEPLSKTYPHVISEPYDNSYGMILYSRLPLENVEVNYLVMEKVPSFVCDVRLRNGETFRLYCVHPEPPVPNADSAARDAEIIRLADMARNDGTPSIVCGDLNDVAWSHTSRLFLRLSQLLDPRVGRGFYNTFDARYPVLRWPLDHLFHDEHFSLVSMSRREHIGSDHFPIAFKLAFTPVPSAIDDPDRADSDDREEAEDITDQADRIDREPIGTDWEN